MEEDKDFKQIRREHLKHKKKDKYKKQQGKPKLFEKGRQNKWKYEG